MEPIHDRMPVITRPEDYDAWLDPDIKDAGVLKGLLRPYSAEAITQVRPPNGSPAFMVDYEAMIRKSGSGGVVSMIRK